jgi:glycosyltransferase involved in cell wall biosynthesis
MNEKICLLITTYNRAHLLNRSLERLTRLTLPDEILIVSDGCTDNTEETVRGFEGRLPIRYIYNHQPGMSLCSLARNIGIKNTDCPLILTSEPELLWCTDVVPQVLSLHRENPTQMVSAGTIYHMGSKAVLPNMMIEDPLGYLAKNKKVNESKDNANPINPEGYVKIQGWQATYTALYRKDWLMEVGGFDEGFPYPYAVDDIDLCSRIRIKCGVNQIIANEIQVVHQYHGHPIAQIQGAVVGNMKYMMNKNLSVNGHEPSDNPNLVANQGREWGVIIPRP